MKYNHELQKYLEETLRKKFHNFVCSIRYFNSPSDIGEIGTGNLFSHNGYLFVLTCSHVAQKILSSPQFSITLPNNIHIQKHQLELYQLSEEDEIALLLVKDKFELYDMQPLTLEMLEIINDFNELDATSVFFICGFPSSSL